MKSQNKKIKNKPQAAHLLSAMNFFAEAGLLKRVKRSGWWVAGIKDPESVAEHCFRCAIIGYYLAHTEGADPYKVLIMTLFNDIHEARINDLHKMGHYYIDFKAAEKIVFGEQIAPLDGNVKRELAVLRSEYEAQKSKESLVARDADILECLIQAKEYVDHGHTGARKFLMRAPKFLKTPGARTLSRHLKQWKSDAWWMKIVKFER